MALAHRQSALQWQSHCTPEVCTAVATTGCRVSEYSGNETYCQCTFKLAAQGLGLERYKMQAYINVTTKRELEIDCHK